MLFLCGCENEDETVRVGFFGPLTGPTAQAGQALRNGAVIAVDEINAQGGLLGKAVKLIEQDKSPYEQDENHKKMATLKFEIEALEK